MKNASENCIVGTHREVSICVAILSICHDHLCEVNAADAPASDASSELVLITDGPMAVNDKSEESSAAGRPPLFCCCIFMDMFVSSRNRCQFHL